MWMRTNIRLQDLDNRGHSKEVRLGMMPSVSFHFAGDATVKAGHVLGRRRIDDYEIVFFPAGGGTGYSVEGAGAAVLREPCILLTRPHETHTFAFDPEQPTRHLYVHFDLPDAGLRERYAALVDTSRFPVVFLRDDSLVPQVMKQLLYYFHTKPGRWQSRSSLLLLGVLEEMEAALEAGGERDAAAAAADPAWPAPVHAAVQYIEEHVTEPLDIAALAEKAGWSHEHFSRTFRRCTGRTPREWINRRRIEYAAQLLLQQTDSARQIALQAGFKDEYYFHRLFRRVMGMTTAEYRKRHADPRQLELAPAEGRSRFYPLNRYFRLNESE